MAYKVNPQILFCICWYYTVHQTLSTLTFLHLQATPLLEFFPDCVSPPDGSIVLTRWLQQLQFPRSVAKAQFLPHITCNRYFSALPGVPSPPPSICTSTHACFSVGEHLGVHTAKSSRNLHQPTHLCYPLMLVRKPFLHPLTLDTVRSHWGFGLTIQWHVGSSSWVFTALRQRFRRPSASTYCKPTHSPSCFYRQPYRPRVPSKLAVSLGLRGLMLLFPEYFSILTNKTFSHCWLYEENNRSHFIPFFEI